MPDEMIPGAAATPARGATTAAARTYLRAVKIAAQLRAVPGAADKPEYDDLHEESKHLMRAGMAAVLATIGTPEAQARAIRLTAERDELEADLAAARVQVARLRTQVGNLTATMATDATWQTYRAEEQAILLQASEPAPYELTDAGREVLDGKP